MPFVAALTPPIVRMRSFDENPYGTRWVSGHTGPVGAPRHLVLQPRRLADDLVAARPHLLIVGTRGEAVAILERLSDAPYVLTIIENMSDVGFGFRRPDLVLVVLTPGVPPPRPYEHTPAIPWIAWNRHGNPNCDLAAYEAGARAVLPANVTSAALAAVVQATLTRPSERGHMRGGDAPLRQYARGARILLSDDEVLRVVSGVVAQRVIHHDGTGVLIGLFGPGQIVVGHPDDSCCLDLIAHAETVATVRPWTDAADAAGFSTELRERLRQLEAWAAVQARPQLSIRLVGLLSLLSDEFGCSHGNGLLVDVRLTHSDLAAATGTTRATVTRVLGRLQQQRLIWTVGTGPDQRFCIRAREIHGHAR